MIGKLTRTIVRTFAFALTICSIGGAWAAVKPLAVWNGDFVANDSRNGYVININGNTISDGCITLNGSGGGVSVTNNTVTTRNSSNPFMIVAGIEGIKYTQNRSTQEALVTIYDSGSNRSDKDRACFVFWNGRTELRWFAAYMSNNNGTISEWGSGRYQDSTHVWPDDQALHYFGASYVVKDSIQTKGWRSYIDGILSSYTESTNSNDNDPPRITYGATIGGTTDGKRLLNNESTCATIKYIAVIRDTNGNTDTDIQAWSLTDMTTVSTDINTTTTTDGVNLPASATLTASATPAAVFVQQTSTLTVTGSGSLNINSGTGPLYVADGTTLTIDATGLTLNDGDTVTLVSGKIYGKDLITVKAPVITGLKVTPTITDTAITLTCATDSVSFISPFTGNTLAAPATGTGCANSATQISFGNNAKFNQTIGDKTAIVVDIVGGTYEKLNGFLYTAENTAANARTKDVYLTLTGGTANRVSGVQDCTLWCYPGTTTTTGDAIVQIEDGATVDFVYGAGGAGGYSGYQVVVNGSTGVTIKGGTVSGSVVGGWTSSHNLNPTVNYDTAVRVETVMGTGTAETGSDIANGYIIGGSAYNRNQSSASTVGRDSSVTLALAGKSGAFGRTVIGGSAQVAGSTSGNQYVTRNSSVTITAANDVTFANPIVGGGAKLVSTGSGAVNVGGNSSVTISGGTYTGRIVAGGYAPNGGTANVAGTATLTLNSGVFTGATLDGGNATGAKTLVVGDNLDITGATVTGFTAVTLGDDATAQMATGEEGTATLGEGATLKLIISEDDLSNGYTPSVSGSGTVEYYEYVDSVLTKVTDSDRLDGNNLLSVAPVWSPAAADGNGNLADTERWSTGTVPADYAAVVKIDVNGSNTLTIDENRIFGRLDVEGTGTLVIEGDGAHNLAVGNLVVASSVTVEVKDSFLITTSIAVNSGVLVLNPTVEVVSDEWTASDNGTLVVYVDSGNTTTIAIPITATKFIKRGAGTLDLTAVSPSVPMVIDDGKVDVDEIPSANVTIGTDGVLALINDSANVEDSNADYSTITGSGILRLQSSSKWRMLSKNHFPTTVTLENELKDGLLLSESSLTYEIGNLAGTKKIRSDYNNGDRHLRINQFGNTEWQGVFADTDRIGTVYVRGGASATGTLTLSGEQAHNNSLTVESGGSVNLTGSWIGDTTVSGEFGGTGSITGALTLNAGSTFKVWATGGLTVTGDVTLAEGSTVAIAFADGVSPVDGTKLIAWSAAPAGTFVFENGEQAKSFNGEYYQFLKKDDGLYVYKSIAWVVDTDTYYLSVSDALAYAGATANVWILASPSTETVTLGAGQRLMAMPGVSLENLTVNAPSAEYVSPISPVGSTYSVAPAATEYTWSATGEGVKNWTDPANWTYGSGTGATRCPTDIDTVVFPSGTHTASLSTNNGTEKCGAITIIGNVTFQRANAGTWAYLQINGDVSGEGTLTLSHVGLGALANRTISCPVVIDGTDSKDALCHSSGKTFTFTNTVTINGEFKGNESPLTFTGPVILNNGGYVYACGSASRVDVRFNGGITVAENASGSLTRTSAGFHTIASQVTLYSGSELGIPQSTTVSGATFVGSGTVSFTTIPSSALTFGENWTGTVVLPAHTTNTALDLNYYGVSGSTVEISGMSDGWLTPPSSGTVVINPNLRLTGNMVLDDMSARDYSFQTISGIGSFSVTSTDLTSMSIAKIASDYTGTIRNTSGKPMTIAAVDLAAVPAVGDRLLKVSGDHITISRVTVNGTPTPLKWKRKTVGDVDGFYVVSGTIFSVY